MKTVLGGADKEGSLAPHWRRFFPRRQVRNRGRFVQLCCLREDFGTALQALPSPSSKAGPEASEWYQFLISKVGRSSH